MPAGPAEIRSVNFVDGASGVSGVNISVLPDTCHWPGTFGLRRGSAELRPTGAEKLIWTDAAPLRRAVPSDGLTATTRSGPTAC